MERIAQFIFEAMFLKRVQRTGYQYLGAGRESVAEHVYATTMIGFILSRIEPKADTERLISMCLVHDLPEARMGDLNYVQKNYVTVDEHKAVTDALSGIAFGHQIESLINEFNAGDTLEAKLANDADQLSLIVDLKSLQDLGYQTPQTWMPHVVERLKTKTGRDLAQKLADTSKDDWWLRLFY